MVDLKKIEDIRDIDRPTSVIEVCNFITLAGNYRQFIERFGTTIAPMARLTGKEVPFQWSNEYESRFLKLKDLLALDPIFTLPLKSEGFII